jgi:hypothetical protein
MILGDLKGSKINIMYEFWGNNLGHYSNIICMNILHENFDLIAYV